MYNDILGDEEEQEEPTQQSIMEAMKSNIKEKDELIQDLVQRITELERHVESLERI